jgi:phospholipid/cholesterol/gamma-HCH transport system substrate-binding protein
MQTYTRLELSVGLFVIMGALALGYLSLTLGGLERGRGHYRVFARFSSVGDLKEGDPVKIAGVGVGEVDRIRLVDFAAETELSLRPEVKLPLDTIAAIQSAGLLGDSYVVLSPGASERDLAPDARIERTQPAISITELIAKYAFGASDGNAAGKSTGSAGGSAAISDPLE